MGADDTNEMPLRGVPAPYRSNQPAADWRSVLGPRLFEQLSRELARYNNGELTLKGLRTAITEACVRADVDPALGSLWLTQPSPPASLQAPVRPPAQLPPDAVTAERAPGPIAPMAPMAAPAPMAPPPSQPPPLRQPPPPTTAFPPQSGYPQMPPMPAPVFATTKTAAQWRAPVMGNAAGRLPCPRDHRRGCLPRYPLIGFEAHSGSGSYDTVTDLGDTVAFAVALVLAGSRPDSVANRFRRW
jgi:hypothetical protein